MVHGKRRTFHCVRDCCRHSPQVVSVEERSEAESAEDNPEVKCVVVTCTNADQLDVETLALNITRDFVRALQPIIALAGTCRTVGFANPMVP